MRIFGTVCAVTFLLLPAFAFGQADSNSIIEQAEQAVRQQLREPDSARFLSAEFKHSKNAKGEPTDVVCGTLSAKNGFGGMSAASGFVYIVKNPMTLLTDPSIALDASMAEAVQMDSVYSNFCH